MSKIFKEFYKVRRKYSLFLDNSPKWVRFFCGFCLGLLLAYMATSLVGCNGGKNQTNIELIQDMMDQESVKAQDWDPKAPDKVLMMMPPRNTVARNRTPYPYHLDYKAAEKNLKNPYGGQGRPDVLRRGRKYFNIYCSVCHGESARGDGLVAPKMMVVKPPSLLSSQAMAYSDARLFHIITDGQGLMSGYERQISDEDNRWAIVNYLRHLQQRADKNK